MKARSRLFRAIALTATATVACLLPVSASADTGTSADAVSGDFGPAAAGDRVQRSGTHSHDLTGDGVPDLLARQPDLNNGALWIYTNSGKLQGTSTFNAKTLVGSGWNSMNWIGTAEITGDGDEYEKVAEPPADLIGRRDPTARSSYTRTAGRSTAEHVQARGPGGHRLEQHGVDDPRGRDHRRVRRHHQHRRPGQHVGLPAQRHLQRHFHFQSAHPSPERTATVESDADLEPRERGHGRRLDGHRRNDRLRAHEQVQRPEHVPHRLQDAGPGRHVRQPTTSWISLVDADGSGTDDVLKRLPNGQLTVYPFLGWNHNPVLGSPVVVGSGWNSMDLIT